MNENDLLQRLTRLLGREAFIEGRRVCVVDILRDGPTLVLREIGAGRMQDNLYGQARRRAPRHFQIPLLSEVRHEPHPVARQLMTDEEAAVLMNLLSGKTEGL